jgi:inorganic pyrophosphatase
VSGYFNNDIDFIRNIHDVVITARPIGVLCMTDEAGKDYKILAVPTDKLCKSYHEIQSIDDICGS